MSFFRSWKSHYLAGYLYGLALKTSPYERKLSAINALDRWAHAREWAQNLKANHPNETISEHQLREAAAWGAGARFATGLDPQYPQPPYPEGYEWT